MAIIINKAKAIQDILKLFEDQLSVLANMDKFKKMETRKKIRDAIQATFRMDIRKPDFFMEIIEDKLDDIIGLFFNSEDFKKNLAITIKQHLTIK